MLLFIASGAELWIVELHGKIGTRQFSHPETREEENWILDSLALRDDHSKPCRATLEMEKTKMPSDISRATRRILVYLSRYATDLKSQNFSFKPKSRKRKGIYDLERLEATRRTKEEYFQEELKVGKALD
ncbi:hypothetical protein E3N88_18948 [Mikania micrantha]|uniref:Uncharacterized protein n=1 Tax=Mikania micrantha TaxID=192012 RepID=A0A5N6NLV8_9ASTR|nr:hypothetical protein E3N88_18948 [Mikania micrantha]